MISQSRPVAVFASLFLALVVSGSAQQPKPAGKATSAKSAAGRLQTYQPVTAERLKNPEDGNWLAIRRTYDGWGFSPLKEITTENVAQLKPVWNVKTGVDTVHEAAPLVNNGVMFVSTPNNQVFALNARTGAILWRHQRHRPKGAFVLHQTNRGAALYGDKVYYAA